MAILKKQPNTKATILTATMKYEYFFEDTPEVSIEAGGVIDLQGAREGKRFRIISRDSVLLEEL